MISLLSDKSPDFYSSRITKVRVQPPPWKLRGSGMFFMGSCFAENLYQEYRDSALKARISPFGNIYNPASLASAAELIRTGGGIAASDCFLQEGAYFHFMFHTLTHEADPELMAGRLNREVSLAREFIRSAEAAVITPGTAFVYRLRSAGIIVNNCHRLPSADFERFPLTVAEAEKALCGTIKSLLEINPELKIILTLSPVRHLRDNAAENSLSKAVLRCAINETCRQFPESSWYFPSYEIVLDELRDYRWYSADLCHPSEDAVSYVISRFISSCYDDRFKRFLSEWLPVLRDKNHRPLNPDSQEYKAFLTKVGEKEKDVSLRYPELITDIGK